MSDNELNLDMDIQETVEKLKAAKVAYYEGRPVMEDEDFDALEQWLRLVSPDNEYFKIVGSPVRGEKVKHKIAMGSLEQLGDTDDEIKRWSAKCKDKSWVISHKLDGNSLAIYYDDNGNFESAVTRGDGYEGLDVSRHIQRIFDKNDGRLPKKYRPGATVRAEVIIDPELFEKHVKGYKNPRNYVAGQMNRTTADEEFVEHVDIIAFDAHIPDFYDASTKVDILSDLSWNEFKIVKYEEVNKLPNNKKLNELLEKAKKVTKYEIDGLVVEANNFDVRFAAGFTHLNPNYSFKFKVTNTFVDTVVTHLEFNPSKDGYIKPVICFDPVDIGGVTITRCTGFNAKFIFDNHIGPGAKIRISRRGDVIPQCERVLEVMPIKVPKGAEYSDTFEKWFYEQLDEKFGEGSYSWNETGVDSVLHEKTDESIIKEMVDFFTGIDVPMLKIGNMTELYERGYRRIEDIIKASESELVSVIGENGSKVYKGLKVRFAIIEEWVLAGSLPFFGRGIGQRKLKSLAEEHGDLTQLTYDKIVNTPGFEEKSASKVADAIPRYVEFLQEMSDYIRVEKYKKIIGDLNGTAVCFTGVRDAGLEKKIVNRGGKITSSVTKETTHLVAKDPNGKSTKLTKARERGVEVISLEEAQELWG